MPTPQMQRSTYRERRISVMLQESDPGAGTVPKPTAKDQPLVDPPKPPLSRPASRKTIMYVSLVTAFLCAAAMFFLLFRHDATGLAKSAPVQPVQTVAVQSPIAMPAPAMPQAEPVSPATSKSEPPPAAAPDPVHFKLRHLSRMQKFGPLSLRLTSTNPRRGTCGMLIAIADQTPAQRTVQLKRALQLATEDGKDVRLVVSGINKDSVSGQITIR